MKFYQSIFLVLAASQFAVASDRFASSANLYHCEGNGVEVNFTSTSFTGQPTYQVKDGNVEINLSNRKDIKTVVTPMGLVVTATYFRLALADGPTYHYNLIVPANEVATGETLKLETQLVKTTVVSPFRPHGISMQIQHNEIFPVKCEAQAVVF